MIVPVGLKQLITVFGDPGNKDCYAGEMKLPENVIHESQDQDAKLHFKCHKLIDPLLEQVFAEIFLNYPEYFYSFGGCYNKRPKRTKGTEMSVHSWGVAVDLNVAYNPLGSDYKKNLERFKDKTYMLEVRGVKTKTPCTNFVFTPEHPIVTAFRKNGFFWGGNFTHTPDSMHFQYCIGY